MARVEYQPQEGKVKNVEVWFPDTESHVKNWMFMTESSTTGLLFMHHNRRRKSKEKAGLCGRLFLFLGSSYNGNVTFLLNPRILSRPKISSHE